MLQQTTINGDTIIAGRNGAALVSSKSQPGGWHCVKNGTCDCKGYEVRGRCRHVTAVQSLATTSGAPQARSARVVADSTNATFDLVAQTLAGAFTGRAVREERDWAIITAGEDVSFAEWKERRAS